MVPVALMSIGFVLHNGPRWIEHEHIGCCHRSKMASQFLVRVVNVKCGCAECLRRSFYVLRLVGCNAVAETSVATVRGCFLFLGKFRPQISSFQKINFRLLPRIVKLNQSLGRFGP